LIDAAAAPALVRENAIPAPGVGNLVFEPCVLDFGTYSGSLNVTLCNSRTSDLDWQATQFLESTLNPGDMLDNSVLISDFSGLIPAGGTQAISLEVDRSPVTADGNHVFAVVFEVLGEASPAYLYGTFVKADTAAPTMSGPMIVAAFIENDVGELVLSGYEYSDTTFSEFAFEALVGANEVIACSGENGNAGIDAGDYLGVFPNPVNVVAGNVTPGVDININEIIDLSLSPAAIPQATEAAPWRSSLEEVARRRAHWRLLTVVTAVVAAPATCPREAGAVMTCAVRLSLCLSLRGVGRIPGRTTPFLTAAEQLREQLRRQDIAL